MRFINACTTYFQCPQQCFFFLLNTFTTLYRMQNITFNIGLVQHSSKYILTNKSEESEFRSENNKL